MKKRITIFWIIISVSINVFSQVNNNTNIDLSILSPEWRYVNSVSLTQNDEIQFVNSINSWDLSYSKTNPLLVFKNNDGLLVNYYTIRDSKEICPDGFRIPLVSDFNQLLKNYFFTFNKYSDDPKDFILKGNQSILRGSEESDGIYSYLDDDNKLRYWVLDNYSNNELGKAISITRNANSYFPIFFDSKPYVVSVLDKKSGLNLYCIEKFDHHFKDTELTYNKLVPIEFSKLENTLTDLMIKSKTKNFNFTGTLRFDASGKNVSDGFGDLDNIDNQSLYNSIKNTILNWSVYPYYNDIRVMSKAPINLKIIRYKVEKSKFTSLSNQKIYDLKLNNLSDTKLFNRVRNCADNDFKFNYKSDYYKIEFNGNLENEPKINLLNKVKGKGPIYSLLSVVPGLGQLKIKQQDGYRKLRLWHFSVPIGAIAIASKIYSNYCYLKYLNNLDGTGSRKYYTNANFSQKIFMSSLGVYSIMSLVDFSLTFGIGCKNKALQYSVNRKIKSSLNQ